MISSSTAMPTEKHRDRSIAARRAARVARHERERLIVDHLNRGVSVAEIAERIGVTEKRMRALVKEILARRMPEAPEDFAAVQVSRLNEALMVAYSAMSPDNLKAVALVVRIVRELDRYHRLAGAAAGRASRTAHGVQQDARFSTGHGARLKASARPDAPLAKRPEMAPEPIEKLESAPAGGVAQATSDGLGAPRQGSPNEIDAGSASEGSAPPASLPAPCVGAEVAPQALENIESAPGGTVAAGEPG
jgi:hypothetical protein